MSDPKRYSAAGTKIVETDPAGPLVEYVDYKILKAEVDEYKKVVSTAHVDLFAENARLKAELDEYRKSATIAADSVIDERNNLKAEVERLRKAGDDVCESPYLLENDPAVIAWRAAKEGKQSV